MRCRCTGFGDLLTCGLLIIHHQEGRTALHCAVRNCKEEIVALLVTRQADVEIKDNYGETAASYARLAGTRLSAVLADPQLVVIGDETSYQSIDPSMIPERIVAKQVANNGQLLYRVKFKGFNMSSAVWYKSNQVKDWIPKV